MLTCYGALSRNRTVGVRIGKGETLAQIRASTKEIAEGVATTPAAARLAKRLNLDCPIIQVMQRVGVVFFSRVTRRPSTWHWRGLRRRKSSSRS
jgi:glycerol-3-phosphate dehydrogenase